MTAKVYDRIVAIFSGVAPNLTGKMTEEVVSADKPEAAEAIVAQSNSSDE